MSDSGGPEWEQKRAVERMVIAMREGDADGMALALADYAAALGTRVTSSLGAIAAPLAEQIRGMRVEQPDDRAQLIEWARGIPELRRRIEQLESESTG